MAGGSGDPPHERTRSAARSCRAAAGWLIMSETMVDATLVAETRSLTSASRAERASKGVGAKAWLPPASVTA